MSKKLANKIKKLNEKLLERAPKPYFVSGEPEECAQKLKTCKIIADYVTNWLEPNPDFLYCKFLKTELGNVILFVHLHKELDFMVMALLEREAKPLTVQLVLEDRS